MIFTKIFQRKYFFSIILILFLCNFFQGLSYNFDKIYPSPFGRTLYGINIAISKLKFDFKKYNFSAVLNQILERDGFSNEYFDKDRKLIIKSDITPLDNAIKSAINTPYEVVKNSTKLKGMPSEDHGYNDFIILAFKIFGYKYSSIYFCYYLILFSGIVPFLLKPVISNKNSFIIIYIFLSSHLLFQNLVFNGTIDSGTIINSRFFNILGILPLIYVSNYILNNHKKFKINFFFFLQLTILIFTIFGRSSGNWMILSIIFLSLYFFLIKLKNLKKNYFNNFLDYNVFIIIFFISFKLLISAYINTGIPSLKSSKHMFWHNLYSGLNSHPNWRSKLDPIYVKNNGGDVGLYKSFENYYSKKPSNQWREGNSVFGYKIDVYENFVKDKYLKFLKENKYFILETYFFYKPKKYFLFLYDLFSKNFNYFFLLNLLFIFGLFLILTNFHIGRNIIILFFLIFSSIPSYLTGFSLWIMGDHIILFVMSLNFVFLKLLFYLRAKIKFYA